MAINPKSLVGKLDDGCQKALERAAGGTLARTNFNVEIEHWLLELLALQDGDLVNILSRYQIEIGSLRASLERAIASLKTGNSRAPGLSPNIVTLASQAWLVGSIDLGASRVRSGHLLLALLDDEALSLTVREAAGELRHIPVEELKREFTAATAGSSEARTAAAAPPALPAVDLKALFNKLHGACRTALEQAAGLTLSRATFTVEIEHWLLKLLEIQDGDLAKILPHYHVDIDRLTADLTQTIDGFKTGNVGAPLLDRTLVSLATQAWLIGSIELDARRVRSGHLLLALLGNGSPSTVREASGQLARIPAGELKRDFARVTADSLEARIAALVEASAGS
jgi:ATP-dependent Clp protease ATP-binding subunit ClpA